MHSADLLCEQVNDFVRKGKEQLVEEFDLGRVTLWNESTVVAILEPFLQWMMAEGHTHYRVTLDAKFRPVKKEETNGSESGSTHSIVLEE